MEPTIDQALKQGITAHKEGKLQDAERLYRSILQFQPLHPDANHNLGLLLISVNKIEAVLPLFKNALEANPKIEQFWVSYIDALIKDNQIKNAKRTIIKAKKKGFDAKRLESLLSQSKASAGSEAPSQTQLKSLLEQFQKGRFDEAEKSAVSLSIQFPNHNFSWKILGALLKNAGRASEAIFAGKKAIEITPEDSEAHILLANILHELGRLDEAEARFSQAIALKPDSAQAHNDLGNTLRGLGRLDEANKSYTQAIALKPDYVMAYNNRGVTLHELGRLNEAEANYTQSIALKSDYALAHSNLANILRAMGRLDEAEVSCNQAIALKPDLVEAHNNLGGILKKLGRLEEAKVSFFKAIALKSDYALAHNNLANTLRELGRLNEAEASCSQAIALKPDLVEAHNDLGITLKELGRLEEAEASFVQAIVLKPDFAEAHNNLGSMLIELGRPNEAISAYVQAIALKPDLHEANAGFGKAIIEVRFKSSARHLYPILINLLTTENFIRPIDLADSIVNILKHDPLIQTLFSEEGIINDFKTVTSAIASLDKLPLLHHLMRICPLPDLQFELLFVAMRKFLLTNLNKIEVSPQLTYFLSTLSLQCFTNEYVYFESDEETMLVNELELKIVQSIVQSEQPQLIELLCLAAYRPLHHYAWCDKQEVLNQVREVKMHLIEEPIAESLIKNNISVLGVISDNISLKVREQYEENPYPRWVKLQFQSKPESIAKICDEAQLKLYSKNIRNMSSPDILVAGCGTGQHSIETASRFSDCQVLAVDLSLTSLAYAQRKTKEFDLNNLNYLQADILELNRLDREFDIIESAGVLHHMDDPMAGWKVLTDLLKPGGLMRIALYSESARSDIVKIRAEIASLRLGDSEAEIRTFRRSLLESHNEHHRRLSMGRDFFSLSTLRDLIFHVQEHRFTLPQIQDCLDELGLKFCGFDNNNLISKFRDSHDYGSDIYDLRLWHQFEKSNPRTFIGMYQFWCQKL